jgi:hypothetical protein
MHEPPHCPRQQVQAADEPHAARATDRQQRDYAAHDDGRVQQHAAHGGDGAIDARESCLDVFDFECDARALRSAPLLQHRLTLRKLLDATAH